MVNRKLMIGIAGVLLAASFATAVVVRAGNPTGPGTPPNATSSYTLEDIHDRLEAGTAGMQSTFTEPAAGPGTGTMHTLNEIMAQAPAADNANGAQVANVQAGKTFWGLNVISGQWGPQTGTLVGAPAGNPDPACWDNTNRYVDCGNGTVMDTVTNLLWLKNANCYGIQNYANANGAAAGLADGACGLTDGSAAGDWRLPTKVEWEETIARAVVLDCDSTPNGRHKPDQHPRHGLLRRWPAALHWRPVEHLLVGYGPRGLPSYAWLVGLDGGGVFGNCKTSTFYVWPVRAGH